MTPFKGTNKVTSPFGWRTSPINGARQHHNGVDIIAPDGNWAIRECTGGTVVETSVGYNYGRGNLVRVKCGNAVETYQHLSSIAVKKGQIVRQGDIIGMGGTTGDSTGTHLHFEVTVGGKAVEPSPWSGIPNKVGSYPGNDSIDAQNTTQPPEPAPAPPVVGQIAVGSVVRLNNGAKFYNGSKPYAFVFDRNHVVSELNGDRAVITYGGVVVGAVRVSDLTKV